MHPRHRPDQIFACMLQPVIVSQWRPVEVRRPCPCAAQLLPVNKTPRVQDPPAPVGSYRWLRDGPTVSASVGTLQAFILPLPPTSSSPNSPTTSHADRSRDDSN